VRAALAAAAATLAACATATQPAGEDLLLAVSGRVVTPKGQPASGLDVSVRQVEAVQDTMPDYCSATTATGPEIGTAAVNDRGQFQARLPWGGYCVHLFAWRDGLPVRISERAVHVNFAEIPDSLFGRLPTGNGSWR